MRFLPLLAVGLTVLGWAGGPKTKLPDTIPDSLEAMLAMDDQKEMRKAFRIRNTSNETWHLAYVSGGDTGTLTLKGYDSTQAGNKIVDTREFVMGPPTVTIAIPPKHWLVFGVTPKKGLVRRASDQPFQGTFLLSDATKREVPIIIRRGVTANDKAPTFYLGALKYVAPIQKNSEIITTEVLDPKASIKDMTTRPVLATPPGTAGGLWILADEWSQDSVDAHYDD